MSTTCPEVKPATPGPDATARWREGGFTLVSVVFILVVLAVLGTAIARMSMRQQRGSAADLGTARAYQAAYAGLEWASFQVLRNPAPPASQPACFGNTNFQAAGLMDFTITVTCSRTPGSGTVSDGNTSLAFYQLVATACNAPVSGACPNASSTEPTYIERRLSRMVMR